MLTWLRVLQAAGKHGVEASGGGWGSVPWHCRKAGWTEWVFRDVYGNLYTDAEARTRFGLVDRWQFVRLAGEMLSEKGRQILKDYHAS